MAKVTPDTLTPAHIRGARGLLNWSARELGERAGVSARTMRTLEAGRPVAIATREAVLAVLEGEGVAFQNGGRPGVRMTGEDAPEGEG